MTFAALPPRSVFFLGALHGGTLYKKLPRAFGRWNALALSTSELCRINPSAIVTPMMEAA